MEQSVARKRVWKKKSGGEAPAYPRLKQTAKWLLRRVQRSLLAALILYKLITILVFVPVLQKVWALALRIFPAQYITTDNLTNLLCAPQMILAILFIGIATAWWALYEFSVVLCALDRVRTGQRCKLLGLLREAAVRIRHAWLPKNWGVLLYTALLIPFTNVFLSSNYISQLAVPEYIAEVIRDDPVTHVLYTVVFLALCALAVCWVLCLHYFILQQKSFLQSVRAAFGWIRRSPLRKLAMLARWSIRTSLFFLVLLAVYMLASLVFLLVIGEYSNVLMLSMWRSYLMILQPFASYLLDCLMVLFMQAFLSACFYAETSQPLPMGRENAPWRKTGGILLAICCPAVLCAWLLVGLMGAVFPEIADLESTLSPSIRVTCHRGYSAAAPENTLPAFEAAIAAGADCAELDVQMTKDGAVVLTHDTSLARTTGCNADVMDLTLDEVKALDAGSYFGAEFAGTTIPTLQEVLDTCKGRIRLNIEIKPSSKTPQLEAETARLIEENGWENDCVVTSLSYESLVKVKQAAPGIQCGYILAVGVGNYYDLPAADFFSVESTFITTGMVQQLHLRGKTVSAWTIDREEDAVRMKELGVDDMITGDPAMVQSVLRQETDNEMLLQSFRDYFASLLPERTGDPVAELQAALHAA